MTNETVILIRCMSAEPRVLELHAQIELALPGYRIIAVPDLLRGNSLTELPKFEDAGIEVLPLTKEYLAEAGLKEAEARTGWVCGDYVFYRALDLDWDFAWVIESDVYFLNGAERILAELTQANHDLIGTGLRKASQGWHWYEPLVRLDLGMDVHAMSFPLVRMSRKLAESAYELRKVISSQIQSSQKMPNDESVISSLAHSGEYSILNIKEMFTDVFMFWDTVTRYNIDDISEGDAAQRIVHSGRSAQLFDKYLHEQMRQALKGSQLSKHRIMRCLETASQGTALRFVQSLLDEFSEHETVTGPQ